MGEAVFNAITVWCWVFLFVWLVGTRLWVSKAPL
jgi:hypothetical protein